MGATSKQRVSESDHSRRPMSRRSFLATLLVGTGGAVLAACGAAPSTGGTAPTTAGAQAPAAGAEKVALRWSMWSATPEEKAIWDELAADVTKAFPNITVTLETAAFADHFSKLQTQLASQTEPDLIAMQSLRTPVFAARKAMRPLSPFIEADPEVNADDFFPAIREGLSFNGELYGFAYDLGPIMMYFNKDLFTAAGVPIPSSTEPMSWDQFREAAIKLSKPDQGQYGFVIQPGITGVVPWLWSGGGDYLNEDASATPLDSPESLAALEFLIGLITKDKAAAPITDLANTQFASEAFYSGKIGMVANGPWNFVNVRKNAAFAWDIMPMPAGSAGSVTWVAGSGFTISNTTKHPEEAWQALKVITSTESLKKTAAAGRGYPARQSAVSAFVDPTQPPEHVATVEGILTNTLAKTRFFRTTTTWQETEVMLTQEFNPVFLGQASVAETIAKVKPKFDELLQKHQQLLGQ
jgi:multiple sugar transport system substrate-binding protein